MAPEQSETLEALNALLGYVEERYADQRATLRDLDGKVGLRLTIYSAMGGIVGLGLPSVGRLEAPAVVLVGVIAAIALFACVLFGTFWLSLRVIAVQVHIPGLDVEIIERTLGVPALDLAQVRRDLIRSHNEAIAGNARTRLARLPAEHALRKLNTVTAVAGMIAALTVGVVAFIAARQDRPRSSEANVPDDSVPSQAPTPPVAPVAPQAAPSTPSPTAPPVAPQAAPTAPSPAAPPAGGSANTAAPLQTQPSLAFPAERIELGEPPTRTSRGPAMPLPPLPAPERTK